MTSEAPQGVQPGGHGPFVRLELLWGRLRRAWLRLVRPGYVYRMAGLRQGDHPGCPHDIIDSRDLKFIRNVCGYWFRPEDDPFRYRDCLGFARYGFAELVGFSAIIVAVAAVAAAATVWLSPWCALAFVPLALAQAEVLWFFRDPERKIPGDPAALLSPADGVVTHAGEIEDADFPGGRAYRISIFLSVFNVHVNRVAHSGRVLDVRYFRGEFLDARHAECAKRNEQLWLDVEEPDGRRYRLKQVSGAIARRIVCWLKVGDEVRAGDRYGMIKFGSRTDVLVPSEPGMEVLVRPGDAVHGGSTVLMRRPVAQPA
jgi:phosphatidylserine decarboxylase